MLTKLGLPFQVYQHTKLVNEENTDEETQGNKGERTAVELRYILTDKEEVNDCKKENERKQQY
ncbi:hypothetical protein [Pseudochryseolinea flava]|uniref:Uncharacterized protein n=1 Tax=Pseudochryseolinea flava TaxID=2059302 RepID=A0A364Y443_9BACT|nr:hypothetical protein [Pseudochryseolinea flava]RAW00958.1 hypothetical protein DQQ10_12010 [Pseudochryseolinea flava]